MKHLIVAILMLFVLPFAVAEAQERKRPVDTLLLLAIDASASVSQSVLATQLEGHASAFRDEGVQAALRSGPAGEIAVGVMLWSSPVDTRLTLPWRIVRTPEDAWRLAADIATIPGTERAGSTGLGSAMAAGRRHLLNAPYTAPRLIIDISSNGFSNIGPRPDAVKPSLQEAEIEVNGLVILDEYDWLAQYFSKSVITGYAPFVMVAHQERDYADALLRKLIRELSYRPNESTDLAELAPLDGADASVRRQ
ncbi:MAG: DUF1194 domain-containing protein [Alphaproteobacteria bacterium]|nr:DUF1194 domain-containing protein [Alphaproteobacteria bacterium SS10]